MEKFKTTPIEKGWLERLRKNGYTIDSVFPDYDAEPIKRHLLSVGGEAVAFEGNLSRHKTLLKKGEFFSGVDAKMWKLKVGQCHENVDFVLSKYPHFYGYTGFALSQDGVWRYHSWVFDTVRNCILETTEKRLVYFGLKQK